MEENIHAGHRQRLKERFNLLGFNGWSEHEVLEFLLFYVFKRSDTNELAHLLLKSFGSLNTVLTASHESLKSVPGVGEQTAYFLRTIGEAFAYMNQYPNRGFRLTNKNTEQYIQRLFINKKHEHLYVIFMDKSKRLLASVEMAEGDFSHIDVNISDILQQALRLSAAFVIVAHNHPSGVAVPSENDIAFTSLLYQAMEFSKTKLLEHYIIGGDECMGILEYMRTVKK